MQAVPQKIASSSKVIAFYKPMGTPAPIVPSASTSPNPAGFWQRHGNTAQWVSAGFAIFGGLLSLIALSLTVYWHATAGQAISNDEHINSLIGAKLDPTNQKVEHLTEQVNDALGQLKRMDEEIKRRPLAKEKPLLAKAVSPKQVLSNIRASLQAAQGNKRQLPDAELINYKNAVLDLPTSARDYWRTVAAVINYQSFLNQINGHAPDPSKVSHPCSGLTGGTGGNNLIQGMPISNCILDLDTPHNLLEGLVITDSVVRYHGGPVAIHNVVFVNCRFVVDLPDSPQIPAHPDLLLALLNSDQRQLTL